MSSADALRLLPTAMKDGQTSSLAVPSQSVDSETNDFTPGSRVNGASRCGLSSLTFSLFIVSLVVLFCA